MLFKMVGPNRHRRFFELCDGPRYSWVLFWLRLSPQRHPGCPKALFQERVAVVSIPGAAIGKPGGPALPRGVQSAELPVLELKRVDHPSIDSQRDNYRGRASDSRVARGADCDVVGALCRTDGRSCLACKSSEDTEESGRTENRY